MPVGAHALCDLDDVRELLQRQAGETAQDDVLEGLINRASRTIQQPDMCGKLRPTEDGATKTFVLDGGKRPPGGFRLKLFPYWSRAVDAVRVGTDGPSPAALAAGDFRARPAQPLDGCYRYLRLPNHAWPAGLEVEAEVDGDWGFAEVPDDVVQACVITVVEWLRKDVAAMSTAYLVSEDRVDRPERIPRAARHLLIPYTDEGQG